MKEPLTFKEWMRQEGYHTYEEIKERIFVDGGNESDVDAEMEPFRISYEEYLEDFEGDNDGEV